MPFYFNSQIEKVFALAITAGKTLNALSDAAKAVENRRKSVCELLIQHVCQVSLWPPYLAKGKAGKAIP